MKRLVIALASLAVIALGSCAHVAYLADGKGAPVIVTVTPGMTPRGIAAELHEHELIGSQFGFRAFLKVHGGAEDLQAGVFEIVPGSSYETIVDTLSSAKAVKEKVLRVIEGWNLHDIGVEVERLGFGTEEEFLKMTGKPATDYRQNAALGPIKDWSKEFPILADKPTYVSLEGYLFPDTYRFAVDAKPEDVVRKLLGEFTKKFDANMIAETKKQKKTVFQMVTMASVIEKEVNGDIDRAKVSDLLWRRFAINWALQCDSTVKYATGNFGESPFTTAADRESQSEYNTYQHPGLPLGPISNAGLASLNAALHPLKNEDWFFLTTPDGEVKYAETLEEHAANKRYLR